MHDMCTIRVEQNEKTWNTLLWCSAYTQERKKSKRVQQPCPEEDGVIGQYLFENKFIKETKRTLHTFWKIREKKMKEKEENERASQWKQWKEWKKTQPVKTEKDQASENSETKPRKWEKTDKMNKIQTEENVRECRYKGYTPDTQLNWTESPSSAVTSRQEHVHQ